MVLNGRLVLMEGPSAADGSLTIWGTTDAALVEDAIRHHEMLWDVAETAVDPGITTRQAEIVLRMILGATDSQIARAVGVSQRTLERELAAVMTVMGATGRVDLISKLAGVRPEPAWVDESTA